MAEIQKDGEIIGIEFQHRIKSQRIDNVRSNINSINSALRLHLRYIIVVSDVEDDDKKRQE